MKPQKKNFFFQHYYCPNNSTAPNRERERKLTASYVKSILGLIIFSFENFFFFFIQFLKILQLCIDVCQILWFVWLCQSILIVNKRERELSKSWACYLWICLCQSFSQNGFGIICLNTTFSKFGSSRVIHRCKNLRFFF